MKRGLLLFVEKKGGRNMDAYTVIIDRENNTVIVKDHESEKVMVRSSAGKTIFDFYDSAVYSMKYLNSLRTETELNCKVICVHSGKSPHFTSGKVYPIIYGKIFSDAGFRTLPEKFHSLNEFLEFMGSSTNNPYGLRFIEYKGEVITKEDK